MAREMNYNLRSVRSKRVREASTTASEDESCFICLAGEAESGNPLCQPCSCPTRVHAACQARWQLQSSGKTEERACRFCHDTLPDWKQTLAPTQLQPADPVMVVTLGNQMHRIRVKPGPEGMKEFQCRIRELFSIPADCEFDVTFKCRAPTLAGDTIQLEGMNSFDAATHCASLMAAQRLATHAAKHPTDAPASQQEEPTTDAGTSSSAESHPSSSSGSTTSSCSTLEPAHTTAATTTSTPNMTTTDSSISATHPSAGQSTETGSRDCNSATLPTGTTSRSSQ